MRFPESLMSKWEQDPWISATMKGYGMKNDEGGCSGMILHIIVLLAAFDVVRISISKWGRGPAVVTS